MSEARATRRMAPVLLALVLGLAGCAESGTHAERSPTTTPTAGGPGSAIPQPALPSGVEAAPDQDRVDLKVPRFSDPTTVTNPLFPVSQQSSVLFVGHVDGLPFRTEVTLLPETRVVDWGGQRIETLVSQYTAFLDGRLQEVAYDLYAQADDGSVWYFGEDVVDLVDGAIVTKEGTWLAGRDGPAQMIMPGIPQVGDVYRAENIPGVAWEQVTVLDVDRRLHGPFGTLPGGMVGRELHMEGDSEEKLFAPGYGEFYTGSGGDVEALALAVPTDSVDGPLPTAIAGVFADLGRVATAAEHQRWPVARAELARVLSRWRGLSADEVPRLVRPRVARSLAVLGAAVAAGDERRTSQAAIDAERWTLDLELRYRPVPQVDLARFGLWVDQLRLDTAARRIGDIRGDTFALFYLRDRIRAHLPDPTRMRVNEGIGILQEAVVDGDLGAVRRALRLLEGIG